MINYSMIIELTVDKKNREKYNLSFVAYVCIAAFQHVIPPPQDDGWKVSERDQTWVTDNDLHDYLIFAYREFFKETMLPGIQNLIILISLLISQFTQFERCYERDSERSSNSQR